MPPCGRRSEFRALSKDSGANDPSVACGEAPFTQGSLHRYIYAVAEPGKTACFKAFLRTAWYDSDIIEKQGACKKEEIECV